MFERVDTNLSGSVRPALSCASMIGGGAERENVCLSLPAMGRNDSFPPSKRHWSKAAQDVAM